VGPAGENFFAAKKVQINLFFGKFEKIKRMIRQIFDLSL
jgi:hypothetical protein